MTDFNREEKLCQTYIISLLFNNINITKAFHHTSHVRFYDDTSDYPQPFIWISVANLQEYITFEQFNNLNTTNMKKILLSMAMLAFIGSANAQLWFGGSVGFNSNSDKDVIKAGGQEIKSKSVANSFSLSPKVGFQISDDLAVGARLTFTSAKTFPDKEDNANNWTKSSTVSFAPFARYTFASFGKFALKGVAEMSFGVESPKSSAHVGGKTQTTNGDKTTTIALNVYPMVSYTISDHFDLEAGLNFFGLSASSATTKDADDSNNKETVNSFGLMGNSDNVLTVGRVTIGFIYKL